MARVIIPDVTPLVRAGLPAPQTPFQTVADRPAIGKAYDVAKGVLGTVADLATNPLVVAGIDAYRRSQLMKQAAESRMRVQQRGAAAGDAGDTSTEGLTPLDPAARQMQEIDRLGQAGQGARMEPHPWTTDATVSTNEPPFPDTNTPAGQRAYLLSRGLSPEQAAGVERLTDEGRRQGRDITPAVLDTLVEQAQGKGILQSREAIGQEDLRRQEREFAARLVMLNRQLAATQDPAEVDRIRGEIGQVAEEYRMLREVDPQDSELAPGPAQPKPPQPPQPARPKAPPNKDRKAPAPPPRGWYPPHVSGPDSWYPDPNKTMPRGPAEVSPPQPEVVDGIPIATGSVATTPEEARIEQEGIAAGVLEPRQGTQAASHAPTVAPQEVSLPLARDMSEEERGEAFAAAKGLPGGPVGAPLEFDPGDGNSILAAAAVAQTPEQRDHLLRAAGRIAPAMGRATNIFEALGLAPVQSKFVEQVKAAFPAGKDPRIEVAEISAATAKGKALAGMREVEAKHAARLAQIEADANAKIEIARSRAEAEKIKAEAAAAKREEEKKFEERKVQVSESLARAALINAGASSRRAKAFVDDMKTRGARQAALELHRQMEAEGRANELEIAKREQDLAKARGEAVGPTGARPAAGYGPDKGKAQAAWDKETLAAQRAAKRATELEIQIQNLRTTADESKTVRERTRKALQGLMDGGPDVGATPPPPPPSNAPDFAP